MDTLSQIQRWYHSQCNGEWEHGNGIKIDTLDNPGWSLAIDLSGTFLENVEFPGVSCETSGEHWFHCWVEGETFRAAGGARNLENMLQSFLEWKDRHL